MSVQDRIGTDEVALKSGQNAQKKRIKTVMGATACLVCLLFVGVGLGLLYVSGDLLVGLTSSAITKDHAQLGIAPEIEIDDSIKSIAVFGVDSRVNSFSGNADTIMVLTIDNKHRKIKLISILRDSKVRIEGWNRSAEHIDFESKINEAYDVGGAELAIRTLNTNFSLDDFNLAIEDYVTINFIQMAKIVDAFGGSVVEITEQEREGINYILEMMSAEISETTVSGMDYLHASGQVLLNGNQAVAYGRLRDLDSDDERTKRQQKVVAGLFERLKSMPKSEYQNLARGIIPMCETSLDIWDILSLMPAVTGDYEIIAMNVPDEIDEPWGGLDEYGRWVYIYDLEQAAHRINVFINETEVG